MSRNKHRTTVFTQHLIDKISQLMVPRYLPVTISVLILTVGAMAAEAKPNFTGDWFLNAEKSTFGVAPAPDSLSMKIEHNEPNFKSITAQTGGTGDNTIETTCTTNGESCSIKTSGADVKGSSKWDGDTLVTNATVSINGMEIMKTSERMSISEDGETLTLAVKYMSAMGDLDVVIVFDKQ